MWGKLSPLNEFVWLTEGDRHEPHACFPCVIRVRREAGSYRF